MLRHQINFRKKWPRGKLYRNDAGEEFFVRTINEGPDERGNAYRVVANMISNFQVHSTALMIVNHKMKDIYIAGIEGFPPRHSGRQLTGRGFLSVFVHEAKQISIKEFKGRNFKIAIIPENEKLEKYYESEGFHRDHHLGPGIMTLHVHKVE